MTATIDSAYISQFSDNIHLLVREGRSKLRGIFMEEAAKGEKHFFDRLGELTVSQVSARNEVLTIQDAAHSRRMATVNRYFGRVTLDDIDKLKMLIDPSSEYAKALADAHGENYDEVLYSALLGSAATGQTGSGTQAFDTANQQIAHGSAGFSVAKFNQALRILEANELDLDRTKLYLALGARGTEDLFGESSVISIDFQNRKALSDGVLPMFRGVNIIRTQRVPDSTSGSVYRGLLFTQDVAKVAMVEDMEIHIDERIDLAHVMQITAYMMFGAVRMEEKKIVDILYQ